MKDIIKFMLYFCRDVSFWLCLDVRSLLMALVMTVASIHTHIQYDQEQPPREILNTQNFWFRNSLTTKLLAFERNEKVFDWHIVRSIVQCYVQFHFDIFSGLFSSLNQSPKNLVQLQCVCWLDVCAMPLGKHLPIRNWKEHISSWVRKIFFASQCWIELTSSSILQLCDRNVCRMLQKELKKSGKMKNQFY